MGTISKIFWFIIATLAMVLSLLICIVAGIISGVFNGCRLWDAEIDRLDKLSKVTGK